MNIQNDAGEILIFVYNEYVKGDNWIDTKKIIETTKWEANRINRAITYLKDLGTIKINLFMGNTDGVYNFGIKGLNPIGIHMVENKTEFKKNFGLEVGIPGVFKFSWGATEK